MTGLSAKAPGGVRRAGAGRRSRSPCPCRNGLLPRDGGPDRADGGRLARRTQQRRRASRRPPSWSAAGPIGLAVILMLKARGVRHVIASDFSPGRRALAAAPAAPTSWSIRASSRRGRRSRRAATITDANAAARPRARTRWASCARCRCCRGGRCCAPPRPPGATPHGPVVFECVGVPGIVDQIINECAAGVRGSSWSASAWSQTASQPAMAINKEIDLQFVFAYQPHEFREALHLIADGKVDPTPLHHRHRRPRRRRHRLRRTSVTPRSTPRS